MQRTACTAALLRIMYACRRSAGRAETNVRGLLTEKLVMLLHGYVPGIVWLQATG